MSQPKVFIALPLKDLADCSVPTNEFNKQALDHGNEYGIHFGYGHKIGVNAPAATSELAYEFLSKFPGFDWFFLMAGDIVTTIRDIAKLLQLAEQKQADIVGGIVIVKPKPELDASEFRRMLTGNFLYENSTAPTYQADHRKPEQVQWFRRGLEIKDDYIKKNMPLRCDIVGGGVALFHRRMIEALRPEKNGGLPYFAYDKMGLAYDIRVFERLKEKGATCWCHCGVLMGHIGKDNFGNQRSWSYWDLPLNKPKEEICQEKKEEKVLQV